MDLFLAVVVVFFSFLFVPFRLFLLLLFVCFYRSLYLNASTSPSSKWNFAGDTRFPAYEAFHEFLYALPLTYIRSVFIFKFFTYRTEQSWQVVIVLTVLNKLNKFRITERERVFTVWYIPKKQISFLPDCRSKQDDTVFDPHGLNMNPCFSLLLDPWSFLYKQGVDLSDIFLCFCVCIPLCILFGWTLPFLDLLLYVLSLPCLVCVSLNVGAK